MGKVARLVVVSDYVLLARTVRAAGYTGSGVRIAYPDGGADLSHLDLVRMERPAPRGIPPC